MQTTNLRNKPLDKRRLKKQDRENNVSRQEAKATAQTRIRRGELAWENKVNRGRQEQRPGTGGFTAGIETQQERLREKGQKLARSKRLRKM